MIAAAALLLASTLPVDSQTQSAGPDRGERVPDFSLSDHLGQTRAFNDLTGENGLLLLFFRSADW